MADKYDKTMIEEIGKASKKSLVKIERENTF